MSETALLSIALLILVWAVLSGALGRHAVTGPIVFTIVGFVLANPHWGPVTIDIDSSSLHALAEVTLALVLFGDASRINLTELRHDLAIPSRLLGIGLPLSIALGGLLAALVFDALPWALAGFIGAALAPTDAALSVQVIKDSRIPLRLRRGLNVESGMNDGIATPIVVFMLAVAASQLGFVNEGPSAEAGAALWVLARGVAAGLVLGWGGALLVDATAAKDWIGESGRRIATFAVGVAAFLTALSIDGNGFIAAFVAGIAFGAALRPSAANIEQASDLTELLGELLALIVWFLFGAVLLPTAFDHLDARVMIYGVVSLTLVRMVPVALSLIGTGLPAADVVFIAWFGPRGLASVVFAILAIETFEGSTLADQAVGVVAFTVALSVLLHGLTSITPGRRYAESAATVGVGIDEHPHEPKPRPTSFS